MTIAYSPGRRRPSHFPWPPYSVAFDSSSSSSPFAEARFRPAAYGAGPEGLIWGYVFEESEADHLAGRQIDAQEAARWLDQERDTIHARSNAFAWLHFGLSSAGAKRWITEHIDLPPAFFEALEEDARSTRVERDENHLVAVLNDVQFEFGFEPTDIATLWIAVGPRLIVTARLKPLRSLDALRMAVRSGAPLRSTAELLEQLMRKQAESLLHVVRDVSERVDDIEEDLLAGRLDTKRLKLGASRRLLVRLQRLLAPEPAALFRVLQHPPPWMTARDVQDLRASTEEFSAVIHDLRLLQERIKLLQEEIAGSVNEDNNRSLFVLTVVTVLALPINILAGLFGMNVGGVPLAQNESGFWIVVSIVAVFTLAACWFAFRDKDR